MNRAIIAVSVLFFAIGVSCYGTDLLSQGGHREHVIASDNCFPWPTCVECIKQPFCGWCSTPVVGGNGAQCAGFGPSNSTPFVCVGTYQTTTCILPTTGSTGSTGTTGTSTGTTTTGSTSSTTTTGPLPGPPVKGFWRGLQINKGYIVGEWNFTFTAETVDIYGPGNNTHIIGNTFSSTTELKIVVTKGPLAGETLYGRYEHNEGPATQFLTYAVSPAGATAPPSSWAAAVENESYVVWALEQPKTF